MDYYLTKIKFDDSMYTINGCYGVLNKYTILTSGFKHTNHKFEFTTDEHWSVINNAEFKALDGVDVVINSKKHKGKCVRIRPSNQGGCDKC